MQNIVIIQRSSLLYLTEAMVKTGPHVSLGVKPLIQKSPQKHLDYCTRLSTMEMRAGCHYCKVV